MASASVIAITILLSIPVLPLLGLFILRQFLLRLGKALEIKSSPQRKTILEQQAIRSNVQPNQSHQKDDASWSGIVGFFHPFCNAGGGGERVLWAAIAATQKKWPNAICAVYTGDHDLDRSLLVSRVKERFGIDIQVQSLQLFYLSTRRFLLAGMYPYFTLLGQSLGSLVVALDAFYLLVPDIFIDTMGYAFAVALCRYMFPAMPTAAYVHYPTISTDMLDSLDDTSGMKGIHSGAGAGTRGTVKKYYWRLFAWLYGWVGRQIDVVMCNSTWTYNHISQLWKRSRSKSSQESSGAPSDQFAAVVYPPCPVEELLSKIKVNEQTEKRRESIILYIAQYRPEKNHTLILRSFAKFYHHRRRSSPSASSETSTKQKPAFLVLIGSVRANTPDEKHIYGLRLLAHELKITDATTFIIDAPFSQIESYLEKATISVNGMYAEHFGIGNVEGLAAGLIPVVHDSGGPKLDIVVPFEGQEIGFRADDEAGYAAAFEKILREMDEKQRLEMRVRGRKSALRFTEENFEKKWIEKMDELIKLRLHRVSGSKR